MIKIGLNFKEMKYLNLLINMLFFWFAQKINPALIMIKNHEKIETVIKSYENCICPFRYKRNALAEALKVGCGTPELCGMHFEYHCYNARRRSFSDDIRRKTVDRWASPPCGSLQRWTTRSVKNFCMTVLIS
jgi:hypothetical protein